MKKTRQYNNYCDYMRYRHGQQILSCFTTNTILRIHHEVYKKTKNTPCIAVTHDLLEVWVVYLFGLLPFLNHSDLGLSFGLALGLVLGLAGLETAGLDGCAALEGGAVFSIGYG